MNSQNPYRAIASPPQELSTSNKPTRGCVYRMRLLAFFVAFSGGVGTWWCSQVVTGEIEPWDSSTGYYGFAILGTAALGGVFAGRQIWLPILGTYLGQVIYCLLFYHPGGPVIIPIVISAGIFGIVPSVMGALLGAIL